MTATMIGKFLLLILMTMYALSAPTFVMKRNADICGNSKWQHGKRQIQNQTDALAGLSDGLTCSPTSLREHYNWSCPLKMDFNFAQCNEHCRTRELVIGTMSILNILAKVQFRSCCDHCMEAQISIQRIKHWASIMVSQ